MESIGRSGCTSTKWSRVIWSTPPPTSWVTPTRKRAGVSCTAPTAASARAASCGRLAVRVCTNLSGSCSPSQTGCLMPRSNAVCCRPNPTPASSRRVRASAGPNRSAARKVHRPLLTTRKISPPSSNAASKKPARTGRHGMTLPSGGSRNPKRSSPRTNGLRFPESSSSPASSMRAKSRARSISVGSVAMNGSVCFRKRKKISAPMRVSHWPWH